MGIEKSSFRCWKEICGNLLIFHLGLSSTPNLPSSGRTLQPIWMGCLVLADRPEPSFFVGWYAHTKTRRVSDVRIQLTQANAEDDVGVYFWATSEATPVPPLSGCREQIPPISRMSYFGSCFAKKIPTATEMVTKRLVDYHCYKSCNLMGNLSEQIFPTPGSTRERRNRHDMLFICFPSHVIRSCSLKPLQVCVPSGVKQTIIAQFFFSILMTGSAINIDFCFFSLRA